jgi:phosphatidylinositol-3-phosphatase
VRKWRQDFRLRTSQMLLLAVASGLSTIIVITTPLGSGPVPAAVVTALRQHVVVRMAAHRAAVSTATTAAAVSPTSAPTGGATSSNSTTSSSSAAPSSAGSSGSTPASSPASTTSSTTQAKAASQVKHIFVIALSSTDYRATWGSSSVAHYLNRTLRPKGTLLSGYRTLGPAELPDYLAMISGQAPNPDTRANCPTYAEFGTKAKGGNAGQVRGTGCVYPSTVQTIGDQVTARGQRWKAYLDDMGSTTCVHPNSNALDNSTLPGTKAGYATRHNPFIYFHSLLDLGDCSNDNVALDHLTKDLRSTSHTPTYSFIAPGLCADASALECVPSQPSGLAAEDAFLKHWVPRILSSAAYRQSGVLIIVFGAGKAPTSSNIQASASQAPAGQIPASQTPASPSVSTTPAIAAGRAPNRAGALILSPFAHRGKAISAPYDPYSVLRTTEQLLGYSWLVNASHAKSFVKQALPGA